MDGATALEAWDAADRRQHWVHYPDGLVLDITTGREVPL